MTYPPQPVVEATSLSSVVALADRPTPHPGIAVETNGQPLTLYIARVPGSRDVFLTPIKPRDKVVTAEDVQSSLYYVHFNEESSEQSRQNFTDQNECEARKDPERHERTSGPIPRRPVPQSPLPYPKHDESPPAPLKHQQISRKPVLSDITNTSPSRLQDPDLPTIPRRPLPPLPQGEPGEVDWQSPQTEPLASHRPFGSHSQHLRPDQSDRSDEATLKQLEREPTPSISSLTLIRRDPGSSEQSNVATIFDPPVDEVSSSAIIANSASQRTKKGGSPLYLDITNPAYAQFAQSESTTRSHSRTSTSTNSSSSSAPPDGVFRRRLYMPGSRYGEHGYSNHPDPRRPSTESADSLRKTVRTSTSSRFEPPRDAPAPQADMRTRGYTFTTPWNSACEFTTGTTGRSLKCRNHPPAPPASVNGYGYSSEPAPSSQDLSELRFNLPTTSANRRSTPDPASTTPRTHRASLASLPHALRRSSHTPNQPSQALQLHHPSTQAESALDLSLGQERAGGGFGGKQAKLGKVIVFPEGFGMLDLLVAANVGLWWRAWERVG